LLAQTLAARPIISMLKKLLVTALLAALALAAALGFWVTQPIALTSDSLELQLENGTSTKAVAQACTRGFACRASHAKSKRAVTSLKQA
jgi:hypothetical protein